MLARSALVMLLVAPLAACGTHSAGGRGADSEAVIQAVMSSPAGTAVGLSELFPKEPKSVGCVIRGGGPGFEVQGTCASRVRQAANGGSVASFVETWDGRAFHGPGSDAKPGLSHTWEFHLDGSDRVTNGRSFGDFPPQSVK